MLQVLLTTYDIAIVDCSVLRRFDWSGLVIDEGHSLKGEGSRRAEALRLLGAPWRLLLTGTPLQVCVCGGGGRHGQVGCCGGCWSARPGSSTGGQN